MKLTMNNSSQIIDKIDGPILITGAGGFIGSNLTRRIAAERSDVHVIVRNESNLRRIKDILPHITVHRADLTDRDDVFLKIGKIQPKTIFHTAAYGVHSFQEETEKIEAMNLHGTINLLDACLKSGFSIFINSGSSSEYGTKDEPMKETDILTPDSDYAVFKAAATHHCQHLARSKKIPVITLRPFSVYGQFEESTKLIPTLISSLLNNTCPPLVSPDTARDYIFIDDVVDAYLIASQKPELSGEIFNIGSGRQTTLKEIVDLSIRLTGAAIEPRWGTMNQRSWDRNTWQADISKAKSILNWSPKTDLKEGLTKTMNWIKSDGN